MRDFQRQIANAQLIATVGQLAAEHPPEATHSLRRAADEPPVKTVQLKEADARAAGVRAVIHAGNVDILGGLSYGLDKIDTKNPVTSEDLVNILAASCVELQQQVQLNSCASISVIVAAHRSETNIALATASLGCHQVMMVYKINEQWNIRRLNSPQVQHDLTQYLHHGELTTPFTHVFGNVKKGHVAQSHQSSFAFLSFQTTVPAAVIIVNEAWAEKFNEQDIVALMNNDNIDELNHETCSRLTQALAGLTQTHAIDASIERNHDVISVLPLNQQLPQGAITVFNLNRAVAGKKTAAAITNNVRKTIEELLPLSHHLQRIQLPGLAEQHRTQLFYPIINDKIDALQLALARLDLHIEKKQSGFLNKFKPKFGPCAQQQHLQTSLSACNELINCINSVLSPMPDENKLQRLNEACHQFEYAIYKSTATQKAKSIIITVAKILVLTALSLVSLAMMPALFGLTMPSFAFYSAVLHGNAVLTSTPAIISGTVLAGTFFYHSYNALKTEPAIQEVNDRARDLRQNIEEVKAVISS